jgi:putative RecB family exonuclease
VSYTQRQNHKRKSTKTGHVSVVREHPMKFQPAPPKSSSTPPPPAPSVEDEPEVSETRVYLSPSAASTWNQCPRKWYHKYVDKIPEPPPGEPAVLGNFVHGVLENLTKRDPQERTRETAKDLAREYFDEFVETTNWKELGYDDDQARKFRRRAWATIETYFDNVDPTRVDPIGQEIRVDVDIDGVPFMGYVDLVERDPDTGDVIVTDYKTGKPPSTGMPWSGDERGEKLLQPLWYAAALQEMGEHAPKRARLLYFTVNERPDGSYEPVAAELGVDVTPESLAAARAELSRRWNDIQQAKADGGAPARTGPLCAWCSYVDRCDEGRVEVEKRWNTVDGYTGRRKMRTDAPAVEILGLQ